MIDLKKILAEDAALVDAELEKILDDCGDEDYPNLAQAMKYSVMSGGKRIRPCMVIECCKLWTENEKLSDEEKSLALQKAVTLAASLELIHTYSLIHDDLPCMDNDDFRRGKPTNHKVFGESTAVLAGDALLTLAFEVISRSQILSDKEKVQAVKLLSRGAGCLGMIGGQVLDILGESQKLTLEQHKKMNIRKTAYLFREAAMLGSFVIGANEWYWLNLKEYAVDLGIAFQVTDDLLDDGEEEEKTTYLSYMSRDEAKAYAEKLTDSALKAVSRYNKNEVLTELAKSLLERKF